MKQIIFFILLLSAVVYSQPIDTTQNLVNKLDKIAFDDSLRNYYFSGTDSIAYGDAYVDITHSCGFTPLIKNIYVTPQATTFGYPYWISNVGATTFRINRGTTGMDAITDKITFSWMIRKP